MIRVNSPQFEALPESIKKHVREEFERQPDLRFMCAPYGSFGREDSLVLSNSTHNQVVVDSEGCVVDSPEVQALRERVRVLEDALRFYVREDDGGGLAMKVLGLIEPPRS